ncbi:non-homologous end joining protein Ku [Candidatus Nitrotoga sp. 1052]|uniref:non-homologous end joining protein Ku n=1 Tax=Candidatus Nitrotoga sp. 1052 TaxID=2886964 RepID=UPI001EF68BE4|nr:Ku protein [Candidatus Nitrotoga sp. 1052]CAH1079424.1 Non-homologous end joining protein Ku [Candidatus Nitrotoga sp. 1052]
MTTSSNRVLWKGAITFGLVHIPIALYSATNEKRLDFDWLDKRSMDPVGYKRINKKTGKEIDKENIVKGLEYKDGQYIVLSPEEILAAYPKTTQTIEIETFVPATDIPFVYLERPYFTAPINKGEKVYALLRETLFETQRIGIARVVIQTRQHLAALIPSGPALILNLLRWGDEIRSWEELNLPAEGTESTGLTDKELKMAAQLVNSMSSKWNPDEFHDSFKDKIMELVHQKVESGDIQSVSQPEQLEPPQSGAQIFDLAELLRNSLKKAKNKDDDSKVAAIKPAKTTAKRYVAGF